MYIQRVVLRNIKSFREADISFESTGGSHRNHAGWAVITGDNGAGKTALLRAICLAILGPDQVRGLVPDLRGWVTQGEESGTISVEISPDHEVDRTLRGGYPHTNTFWAELEIVAKEGDPPTLKAADIFRNKRKGAANGPWAEPTGGWFCLGYGPFRRMYGSSPDAQRLMVIPGRIPHFATLFKEDATLGEGEEWIKALNYRKLEGRDEDAEALRLLLELIEDDFLRQGLRVEGVDADGLWLRDSFGRRIPFSDMSEGYRSALAMLIDIYRHMVATYGIRGLVDSNTEGRMTVSRPGVVLIDEIDAHLHPQWQRQVGEWLKTHFPRVQFIVTTHSPIVCQSADGGRIYYVPAEEGSPGPFRVDPDTFRRIVTGRPDQILLSPAFNLEYTRSAPVVRARKRHAQLVSKQLSLGSLPEAEKMELLRLGDFVPPDDLFDAAGR